MGDAPDFADAMADVARALQAEAGPQHTLQRMVDLAVTTVTGCDYAAVSFFAPDRIYTPAASHPVALQVDLIQYDTDQGPCLSAIRDQDMYTTGDLRTEERWPAFATRATTARGIRSMLSLRLFVEGDNLGALNMYSRQPDAFDEDSIAVGRQFVAHAAIALSDALESERSERRADRFQAQAGIAVHLQRSMLTELPDMAPFTAAARYVPAVVDAEVGGDWYDALVLPSGDFLLVVGDVTGGQDECVVPVAAHLGVYDGGHVPGGCGERCHVGQLGEHAPLQVNGDARLRLEPVSATLGAFALDRIRQGDRSVGNELTPDGNAVFVERVRLPGVHVQSAEVVPLNEQAQGEHRPNTTRRGCPGGERRPTLLGPQVPGRVHVLIADRGQARSLVGVVLDQVDLQGDRMGCRRCVDPVRREEGDRGVIAASHRRDRQVDHALKSVLGAGLGLQSPRHIGHRIGEVRRVTHAKDVTGSTQIRGEE